MIICIIAYAITIPFVAFILVDQAKLDKRLGDLLRDTVHLMVGISAKREEKPKPFSLPDYFDRMEKLHLKLMQEREERKPQIITLWWGFDGLRLNQDGTTKWVSRRPAKKESIKTGTSHKAMNQCCTDTETLQKQLLRARLAQSQINVSQQIFNQELINSIKPIYPTYSSFGRDIYGNIYRG